MRIVLILTGIMIAAIASAEVYRWVDEDGSVHYSDRPHEGAETVVLPPAQTFKAPVVNRRTKTTADADQQPQPAFEYKSVQIVSPIQEEVLWNTGGQIDVAVRVEPALQPGHQVVLYLDDQAVDGAGQGTQFTLTEVFRGQHKLRAEVRGSAGAKLIESRPVSFTVQQSSLLNPPAGSI